VQDAILELGPDGYTFRPGLRPEAVAATPAVQARRVVEALASERRRAVLALAVAGPIVDDARWRDLCARLGATVDARTLAAVRRVAAPEEGRWRFTSELARRALASAADEELTRIVEQAGRQDTDRALLADDDASVERALDELLRAVEGARLQGRLSAARTLLAEADRVLRRLGAADSDPRWYALHLQRGALATAAGELQAARAWLEPLLDGPLGVDARLGLAELALVVGDRQAAERWLVEVSPEVVDTPHEVQWVRLRSRWLGLQGAPDEVTFVQGALARHGEDPVLQVSLGAAHTRAGNADEAVRVLEAALGPLRDVGSRLEVVRALVELGEASRCAGRRRRAARRWEEALELALACEHPAGWTALMALVLLRAEEGRMGEVLRLVERHLQRLPPPVDPAGHARVAWLGAVRAAAADDDGAWREARSALSAAASLPLEETRAQSALAEVARANGRRFP
jgi:tetratricopeptide (TPR) repeat protein